MKKTYTTPELAHFGRVEQITSQTCAGGGIDLGLSEGKNIGYPSDQVFKIIPICEAPAAIS